MNHLPNFISPVFVIITFLTLYFCLEATKQNRVILFSALIWLVIQALISLSGFYKITYTTPPRIMLAVIPVVIFIIALFISKKGRNYMDTLDTKFLVLLHVIRFPLEVVLFWLFCEGWIPQIMTFEGRNFDIISGLTAPLIWYFGYIKLKLSKNILLIWNFLALGLLINVVLHAILSLPTSFQTFGFEQPNIAVLYFPYIWLPSFIVPVVLVSHLIVIRNLLKKS